MHLYETKHKRNRSLIAAGVVFLAVVVLFGALLASSSRQNSARETALLDSAIRRAVVTCYAVEGKYPPNFAYLTENYGVRVDETRYAVYYDVFAENVMPTVTVTALGGGR